MKKMIALVALMLISASCEKIEGQLNVTNDIKLVNSRGDNRVIRLGTYTADVSANTSKKITLRLNNDSSEKYNFNIPDGSIPTNGAFTYKSSTVGQPVDIQGVVQTKVTESDRRQTIESCQYQRPVQVCYPNPKGGVICSIQYQTVTGMRHILYVDRTTAKDLTLSIAAANSNTESAQFAGDATWTERIILNQGMCQ